MSSKNGEIGCGPRLAAAVIVVVMALGLSGCALWQRSPVMTHEVDGVLVVGFREPVEAQGIVVEWPVGMGSVVTGESEGRLVTGGSLQ